MLFVTNKSVYKIGSFLFFISLFSIISTSSIRIVRFLSTPLITESSFHYYLKPGASVYHVTADLLEKGILQNPRLFLLVAYLQNAVDTLKTGEYQLSIGTTPLQCLKKMKEGKVTLHRFTIVEGWTFHQLLNNLITDERFKNDIDDALFISLGKSSSFILTNKLEGLFLADSYDYPKGTPMSQILQQAADLMTEKLASAWEKRAINLPWKTPYEVLIAASLIEKETAIPEELPEIAGVIINRLAKNMPLQIDASVVYGMGEKYKGNLTKKGLKTDTPYNTYTRRGLPPTPIAIPSLAAIEAACHPATTQSLYFVTTGNGHHVFTRTLHEHQKAVLRYRKQTTLKLTKLSDKKLSSPMH